MYATVAELADPPDLMPASGATRQVAPRAALDLSPAPATAARWQFRLKVLAVALAILGSRWWLIRDFGSPLPFCDQWAEADQLYLPWLEHRLTVSHLVAPHNEHRIVWTRLVALLLLTLNDQWDPRLQMAVNALLPTATALFFMVVLARLCGRERENVVLLTIGALWSIPFGFENTLWGFQSQFYFLVLLAALTIWGLLLTSTFSPGWWAGAFAALAGVFSMGSGLAAGGVVLAAKALLLGSDVGNRRSHVASAVVGAAAVGIGLGLCTFPAHAPELRARGPADFIDALATALSWPCARVPWLALLMYLPSALLAAGVVRSRRLRTPRHVFVLALAAWVIVQAGAVAFSRGASGIGYCYRYMDVLALGPLVNLAAIMLLADAGGLSDLGRRRRLRWLAVAWSLVLCAGVFHLTARHVVDSLQLAKSEHRDELMSCRRYLTNPPPRHFAPSDAIPYPEPAFLETMLASAQLQRIYPPALQTPPALRDAPGESSVFVENGYSPAAGDWPGESVRSSYNGQGAAAMGRFESDWIEARLPLLRIPVAGYPREEGMSLALRIEGSDEVIPVDVPTNPGKAWRYCYVRAPSGRFRVVAQDHNPAAWLAFGSPFQVGWLSRAGEIALDSAWWLVGLGLALFAVAGGLPARWLGEIVGHKRPQPHWVTLIPHGPSAAV